MSTILGSLLHLFCNSNRGERSSLLSSSDGHLPQHLLVTSPPSRLIPRNRTRPNILTSHKPYKHKFSDIYHYLIDLTWWKLFLIFTLGYILIHLCFAFLYWIFGGIEGIPEDHFVDYFWFSVHTMSTIGFGNYYPIKVPANVLVAVEAWCSYFVDAFMVSLVLGKFSRPSRMSRNIVFSKYAVIYKRNGRFGTGKQTVNLITESLDDYGTLNQNVPSHHDTNGSYHHDTGLLHRTRASESRSSISSIPDHPAFLNDDSVDEKTDCYLTFRCINMRFKSQFLNTKFKLLCIIHDPSKEQCIQVHELDFVINQQMLQNTKIEFSAPTLPLPWTVTHRITKNSPLHPFIMKHGTISSIPSPDAPSFEVIPVLDGVDGATSDSYQAKFSYRPDEIYVDCTLEPCISFNYGKSRYQLDFSKFHNIHEVTEEDAVNRLA